MDRYSDQEMCYLSITACVSAGSSVDQDSLPVGDVQCLACLITGRHDRSFLQAATWFALVHALTVGTRLSFPPLH